MDGRIPPITLALFIATIGIAVLGAFENKNPQPGLSISHLDQLEKENQTLTSDNVRLTAERDGARNEVLALQQQLNGVNQELSRLMNQTNANGH